MNKLLLYHQDIFSHSMEDMIRDLMDGKMSDKLIFPGYVSVVGFIWYYLGVFLFIMLIQYFFSETLKKATDKAIHHTLRSMVFGLAFFTLLPVLISLLMATLLGIPLGLLILIAYLCLVLLVVFISSVSVANWINRLGKWNWGFWAICSFALAVFMILNLLLMVPVLGWVVLVTLSCLAFGSVLLNVNLKATRLKGL
ncbi:hypothetical protein [Pedobacter panaciterrae]